VAVAVVTGKEAEVVVVNHSAVGVGLATVVLAGRVVDDPPSWIVTAKGISLIVIARLIVSVSVSVCSTESAIGIPCGSENVTATWTGGIDLSGEMSGKSGVQIVRSVTGR
jgi:hypothetical protein